VADSQDLYTVLEIELKERRERRFLNLVSITLPNHGVVTFISADTSDKKSMAKLEKDLRDRFDQPS
jgi:hypothetical protein